MHACTSTQEVYIQTRGPGPGLHPVSCFLIGNSAAKNFKIDIFHPACDNPAKCSNTSKLTTAACKLFFDFVCVPMVPNYLVNMAIASPRHGEYVSIQHDGVHSTDFANTRYQVKIPNVLYI